MQIIKSSVIMALLLLLLLSFGAYANSGWVNNQGCYCGSYSSEDLPVPFISKGNGTLLQREASQEQIDYWNTYAGIFTPLIGAGYGEPGNEENEINTLITNDEAQSRYGLTLQPELYGVAIIQPMENFGNFNECKDFDSTGCDEFSETDVLINEGFVNGWTTDPTNYTSALIQTTALHELGHTWGAHHVFSLPDFGDSYSTMNYINDDSGRFITRMDANTIRSAYSGLKKELTDIGIFPFIFGNSTYAETYTSVSPTTVQAGETLNISNFLIQNIGTESAEDVVITFYLSPDTTIESTDSLLGTASYKEVGVNAEEDLQVQLPLPADMPIGNYYIGAIVTVDGTEDAVEINNTFIIGRPTRTVIKVTEKGTIDCIVEDPGFEEGINNANWSQTSTNFNQVICSTEKCSKLSVYKPHSGTFWVWFGGTIGVTEIGSIQQPVTFPLSPPALLEFYLRIPIGKATGYMRVLIDDTTIFNVTQADANAYETYQLVQLDVSAFADGAPHILRLESYTAADSGATNFFVDDLCITATSSPDIIDYTGTWQYAETGSWTSCEKDNDPISGTGVLEQTGTTLKLSVNGHTYEGSITGNTLNLNGSYPKNGGSITEHIVMTMTSAGKGSGTVSWTFNSQSITCSGGQTISAAKGLIPNEDKNSDGQSCFIQTLIQRDFRNKS